ncbi:glycosyltransferase family 4 protein [Ulvibacterium marinum]|uniref:Glycosyltransferase family 1 protein n=1 Tax=Ulvibacterium marinum TaxID=2419782 RepID=A0A3B0C7X5_9FLAO|nr:glycosyltransferase family 4 protein [Ulvibacterium marinum]RKN79767.1 glycosyltransferase family 1 protein [Ulvibacterium marinum]
MKILFIHNNYASNTSGEEQAAEALREVLVANGHEVKWFRRFSDVISDSFWKKVQAFFSGMYNPGAVKELKGILDEFQPDIVQVQNLYPFISPGIIRTIKRRRIPLVMRCPNYRLFCPNGLHLDPKGTICEKCLSGTREWNCIAKNCEEDIPKSIGYALRNFLARTVWGVTKTMDAYIVQTAFQRQKFMDNGIPPEKLFIVPGLTPVDYSQDELLIPKYVSFIGRISREKGILEFLEAARLLPKIPFVVAGSIPKSYVHLKSGSPENVTWKGYLSGKELDKAFGESKMVVVPSKWYEGFPNVITRAMKHARPIIASNLGAMSAIIDHGENGLLVEPGDAIGLAKAIRELYDHSEKCKALGAKARIKADTWYTREKVYENVLALYDILLQQKEKKAKKILSVLHYPPPVHGAAMVGQYIMESKLINDSFDLFYINLGTSTSVHEIGQGGWSKIKRFLTILKQTFEHLQRHKPQLVYITLTASGAGFYKDAFIVLLAKWFRKKVVFHFHNKGVSRKQTRWWDHLLYKMVFRKSEVILLSEHLYYDVKKYVPKERVHFCPNGIPPNMKIEHGQRICTGPVRLLFLSNMIESKGVFVLLEACRLLQKKNLQFHCTFIGSQGDIEIDQFHNRIKNLGLDGIVEYAGRKYGIDKEEAYAKSDIFVFPTYYPNETFGLVNLEAMQFSLPIVSTFEGGIPDVVKEGETGFLVEKESPEALAKKLELLIRNPELRMKMGRAGRKRYEEHFTLEAFETRFHNIMEKLI